MTPLFNEIRAEDLESWADTPEAKQWMPSLLVQLIHTSQAKITACRFLTHAGINHAGWDGVVQASTNGLNVTEGISGWEISTRKDAVQKLNEDFISRCTTFGSLDPASSTLVLVSLRRLPDKHKWLKDRMADCVQQWNCITVLDAEDVYAWLKAAPGVALWLAYTMGRQLSGVQPLSTYWESNLSHLHPSLVPEVFLAGRGDCFERIGEALNGNATSIELTTFSFTDFRDALACWWHKLETNDHRRTIMPVYVENASVWKALSQSNLPFLLLADSSIRLAPELIKAAEAKGHWIVRVLETQPRKSSGVIATRLPILAKSALEEALNRSGIGWSKAHKIAKECGGNGTVLKRLLSNSLPQNPPWALATVAPVLLLGAWDSKQEADRMRVSEIFNLPYEEVEVFLKPFTQSDDPLLRELEGYWRVLDKSNAWHYLGGLLEHNVWPKFEHLVKSVLGEKNPAYDLDPEKWWAANAYGKEPAHSRLLHNNVGESLCLLENRLNGDARSALTIGLCSKLVKELLASRDWRCWLGLGEVLPLLAEASPETFLLAVESDLQCNDSICRHFFQLSQGGFTACHPHTNIVRALEVLFWIKSSVKKAILAMASLAESDPGGNCYPRPISALQCVFDPREAQSCLPLQARLPVLRTISSRYPKTGRELLASLITQDMKFTNENHRPQYTDSLPQPVTLWSDYWDQICGMAQLLIEQFGKEVRTFKPLIHRLDSLRKDTQTAIWQGIHTLNAQLDECEFYPLWKRLQSRLRDQMRAQHMDWSLKGSDLEEFRISVANLAPKSLVLRNAHLFSHHDVWFDELDFCASHEEQEKAIRRERIRALREIVASCGSDGVAELLRLIKVPWPGVAGNLVAEVNILREEDFPLVAWLHSSEDKISSFAQGFASVRVSEEKWTWLNRLGAGEWEAQVVARIVDWLPYNSETEESLTHLNASFAESYWRGKAL